jgi:hypothetical protein
MKQKHRGRNVISVAAEILILFLIIYAVVWVLSGCAGSKKIDSSAAINEEKKTTDSSSYWKLMFKTMEQRYHEYINESIADLQFERDNNREIVDAYQQLQKLFANASFFSEAEKKRADSLFHVIVNKKPCETSLETKPDGSIVARGLKSANLQVIEQNRKIEMLNEQLDAEINKRMKIEEQLKTEKSNKQTVIKRSRFWIGFTIGFVCMFAIMAGLAYVVNKYLIKK